MDNYTGTIIESYKRADEIKALNKINHKWYFDMPWDLVEKRYWFYMINYGVFCKMLFLHVRILGVRFTWEVALEILEKPV